MRRSITREIGQAMVLSALLLGALGSCGHEAKEQERDHESESQEHAMAPPSPAPQASPSPPASDTAMTDANIEGVLIAADQITIQNAQLAQANSTNDAVKAFALQMVTDHTSVDVKIRELAGTIGIAAQASAVSGQITSEAYAKRGTLRGLSDGAFDRVYIQNEIVNQQAIMDLLDSTLIPRARNTDLEALLVSVRPSFVEHITHAKKVEAALAR